MATLSRIVLGHSEHFNSLGPRDSPTTIAGTQIGTYDSQRFKLGWNVLEAEGIVRANKDLPSTGSSWKIQK